MIVRLTIAVACIVLFGSVQNASAQDILVLTSTDQLPAELRSMQPTRVVPNGLLEKGSETLQDGKVSASLLRRLRRYVRISRSNMTATIDSIRSIPGVIAAWNVQRIQLHAGPPEETPISDDSLSSSQSALELVGARQAWQLASGTGITIGIIDTGIDWDHEDLRDALAISPKEDLNANGRFDAWPYDQERAGIWGDLNGIDDDDNGMVDDVIGADFVDQEFRNLGDDRWYDPVPFDEHGHGTLVAGVIAATKDNRKGIAGLAHGARLRAIRAFDATGSAEEDDIAAGLVYAASNGVDIVNMSFGDGVNSPLMQDAIEYARTQGCILVASAGNSGIVSTQYPASYTGVIVVAATTNKDLRAPFSSTGPVVSLSAPGQAIITTSVNSRYRTVSGTSFSAPYVAATAALLLERFPDLGAEEIRGTLMASSKDLGEIGWDPLYGAGRLRADAALAALGTSRLAITHPLNEQEFFADTQEMVVLRGSNHITNFERCEVSVGQGVDPRQWTVAFTRSVSVINDTIGELSIDTLSLGLHTLRMRVYCTDGRHHDAHVRIRVIRQADNRRAYEHVTAWMRDRKTDVVTLSTFVPTNVAITDGSAPFADIASTPKKYAALHSIVLPDTWGTTTSDRLIQITTTPMVGESFSTGHSLVKPPFQAIPTTGWDTVLTAPWAGYVLNDVRDLYRDGGKCVVMNDLSDGAFGRTVVTQYKDGRWILRDSLSDTYIPRAICDANGNGRYEVLCHVVGKTVLFEQQTPTSSLFGSVLFADTTNVLNAAGAADIDGDGREEILALADNACYVYTCKDDKFSLLGIAKNTSEPPSSSATNRVDEISIAAGDFDGDGKMEIAFSDTDGDLVIHEWNGASFEEEIVFENPGAGGSGFVAAGDVNADGLPDILHGIPDSVEANADGEYGRQVWTYNLYTADQSTGHFKVWTDRVAGVRLGIGYRNGVAIADIDSMPGAEIIISAFPRLFVFGRDTVQRKIVPKAFFDDVATPRVLAYDVDNDGRVELGFGSTIPEIGAMTNFTFVRQTDRVQFPAPSALRGVHEPTDSTLGTIRLSWFPVDGAASYQVTRRVGRVDSVIAETTSTSHVYKMRGIADSLISFVVRAVPSGNSVLAGRESNRVVIDARPVILGVGLDRTTITRRELRDGLTLSFAIGAGGVFPRGLSLPAQQLLSGRSNDVITTARYGRPRGDIALDLVFPGVEYTEDSLRVTITIPVSRDLYVGRTFTLRVIDTPEPERLRKLITLSGVTVRTPLELTIRFSHPVDGSALKASAYQLRPAGVVSSVARIDDSTVLLALDAGAPLKAIGITYAITARDVTFDTTHAIAQGAGSTLTFSVFGSGEQDVYAYPQPLRLQAHQELVFAGLPAIADVEIFDVNLKPVAFLRSVDGNGGLRWNLRTASARDIEPGVYYYIVTSRDPDGSSDVWPMKKLLIQR